MGWVKCDVCRQHLRKAAAVVGALICDPRVQQPAALVATEFRKGWGMADHARALGISPRHLSRLCAQITGLSGQGLIESLTFREAGSLLVYTRMTVQSVAYANGFQDPQYFAPAFQRHVGQSQTAYRTGFDS